LLESFNAGWLQASLDLVMLACPPFCPLQFTESGVNVLHRLYSVAALLMSGVRKLVFRSS